MPNNNSVSSPHAPVAASTQRFLPIGEVKDGVLVLKNGGMRAVIQTSSVNFNLKSEDEQNALEQSYQGFLNSLEFPIQIIVSSKKLDVDKYVNNVKELAKKQSNPLLQKQTSAYGEYIEKLVEYADIMEKKFFVVIPVDPVRNDNKKQGSWFRDLFMLFEHLKPQDSVDKIRQRHAEFDDLKHKLMQRVSSVQSALESCNIRSEQLNTEELVEMLYQNYNPILAREQKVEHYADTDVEKE